MKEISFIDYKGNHQKQYDREWSDADEDILKVIPYPKRVQVIICKNGYNVFLPAMDLCTFKANLHKFKPLSVVNYWDARYSSVVVEERLS